MAIYRCLERPYVSVRVVGSGWDCSAGFDECGWLDSLAFARIHGIPVEAVDEAVEAHPEYGERIEHVNVPPMMEVDPGAEEGATSPAFDPALGSTMTEAVPAEREVEFVEAPLQDTEEAEEPPAAFVCDLCGWKGRTVEKLDRHMAKVHKG